MKMDSSRTTRTSTSFWKVFTLCVVVQLIHCPLSTANVYRLPVKLTKRLSLTSKVATDSVVSSQTSHVVRRDAPSQKAIDKMEQNLNGISGDGYYVNVDIGTPPQTMQLLIDTGSANLALACEKDNNLDHYFHRERSNTYDDQDVEIYVPYTEGEWTGTLGKDIVGISTASNLTANAYVSCITSSKDFYIKDAKWQGILGLSYSALARPDDSYVPWLDSLTEEHPEVDNIFSIQLCGNSFVHTKDRPLLDGSLILGGIDPKLTKTDILYTPIYKEWYYEVILTDMEVAGESLNLNCKEYNFDKTIVDTGTTTVRLPYTVFDAVVLTIQKHIMDRNIDGFTPPRAEFYRGESVLCYPDMSTPFKAFPVVSFYLMETNNSSFRLDLSAQHYLRAIEAGEAVAPGSDVSPSQVCVKFGFTPSASGAVLGAVLMEAFYVVFDRENSRIGFGQTTCPLPDPDNPIRSKTIDGPISSSSDFNECAYKKPETKEEAFLTVVYLMAAVSVVLILPVIFLFLCWTTRPAPLSDDYNQLPE